MPSQSATIEQSYDESLRERLREVVGQHSQAEISRRTGVPHSSISRYLKDRKVPSEFCAALIKNFNVNPAWLMVGEGTRDLTEVTSQTADSASDLLELVQAMQAVMKMRLGALVGRDHAKMLRELNYAMEVYEKLRERMNVRSLPLYHKLIEDFEEVLEKEDHTKGNQITQSITQISRFCEDSEYKRRFLHAAARNEFLQGNHAKALTYN